MMNGDSINKKLFKVTIIVILNNLGYEKSKSKKILKKY